MALYASCASAAARRSLTLALLLVASVVALLAPPVDAQLAVVSSLPARGGLLQAEDAGRDDKDRTGLDPRSPIFRKLVAGIVYSNYLVLTYYYVVAAILLLAALANWGSRAQAWLKRRSSRQPGIQSHSISNRSGVVHADAKERVRVHAADGASSSSSSTASQVSDEQTPLIGDSSGRRTVNRSVIAKCRDYCKAWLMYQPEPLPGFQNRAMPSNATSLLMSLYLGINVFYLSYNIEFSLDLLFILADRAAQLFAVNLPVLYVLSTKNQPLQPLVGYSYASLNIIHRRLGEWMCILGLVHGVGMVIVWATLLHPGGYEWTRFFFDKVVLLGLGALFCYQAIWITSIATIRQRFYELFLATHIILQVGALGFLYFHHSKSRPYVSVAIGIWALDRIIYRLWAKTRGFKAAISVLPDEKTVSVVVSVPLQRPSHVRRILGLRNIRNGWRAPDHIFLTIPALAAKHVIQAHPFSIASEDPAPDGGSADLELIIRARNGFSSDLRDYAKEHEFVNVRIDGPYGAHSASRLVQDAGIRIIIAGGSGIAVAYPLLEQIISSENAQSSRDLEIAPHSLAVRSLLFVWVIHSREQWAWCDLERLQELGQRAGIEVVLPLPTHEAQRPDLSNIVDQWLEAGSSAEQDSIGVVVSGPDEMSREVRNHCADLTRRGRNVHLEVEKYGW